MPKPRRIHILVEGCLDAVLARWLAWRGARDLEVEVEVAGGWTGVVRQLVGLLASTSPRVALVGIVDADEDVESRINHIEELLARYAKRRGLVVRVSRVRRTALPPLLRVELEVGSGVSRAACVSFWCTSNCCRGTVEDVIMEMLEERYSYQPVNAPDACSSCPSERCSRDYTKYAPVLFLAACARRAGTPVLVPSEQHCGIDVRRALESLDLASSGPAQRYRRLMSFVAECCAGMV